jgi:AP-1 complex subunit mu
MMLSYLQKLSEVLLDYFTDLEEESIRDNFATIYELLDEMMDNGYPQTTESKVMSEFIKTEKLELNTKAINKKQAEFS